MIRSATLQDASDIALIHVSTWQSAYKGIMPAAFLSSLSLESRGKMWTAILERNSFNIILAEEGDIVVGFCHSVIVRGEGTKLCGDITALYVLPKSQGRGHGLALMEATELDFRSRGIVEAVLWVLEANERARRFYERLGYQPDGGVRSEEFGPAKLPVLRYRKVL